MADKFLIANHLVPDNEVWVSPKTFENPSRRCLFSKEVMEAKKPSHNTASLKLPSWFDLTKDIAYKSPEALYAAKEIYSRIAACQNQA